MTLTADAGVLGRDADFFHAGEHGRVDDEAEEAEHHGEQDDHGVGRALGQGEDDEQHPDDDHEADGENLCGRAHLVGNIAAEGSGQDAQAKGADGPEHGAEGDGRAEDVGGVGGHVGDADVHAVAAEDQTTIIHTAGSFMTVSALLKGFSFGAGTLLLYGVLSSTKKPTAQKADCPRSMRWKPSMLLEPLE